MHTIYYIVDSRNANKRLDIFLSEQTLPLTRSHIKKLITAPIRHRKQTKGESCISSEKG